jgi:Phasin protein
VKWRSGLGQRQILGAYLTTHLVGLDLERDFLALGEPGKTSALDRTDVHKHIISTVARLDKAKTLLAIEPLNSTCRHSFVSKAHSRVVTRFRFNWSDVFGKEPAGAFGKAQRQIEPLDGTRIANKAQGRHDTKPEPWKSDQQREGKCLCSIVNPCHMIIWLTGGMMMTEPNVEVSAELRQLAEKTIDQVEKAFGLFFDAARRSTVSTSAIQTSAAELSRQVLAFSEESLKTSFEHARKVAQTTSLQEIATAQSELVKRQIAGAEHHIRELAKATGSKDPT